CMMEAGLLVRARRLLDSLEVEPSGVAAAAIQYEIALLDLEEGDLDAARLRLAGAGQIAPDVSGFVDGLLAVVESRSGNLGRAVELARRAVADAPSDLHRNANLAGALARMGAYEEAIAIYEWVLQRSPHDERLQRGIAWALACAERW